MKEASSPNLIDSAFELCENTEFGEMIKKLKDAILDPRVSNFLMKIG